MTGWAESRREAALWRDFERSEAEQVACPECHVPAGERCQNLDGGGPLERLPAHWRRIKVRPETRQGDQMSYSDVHKAFERLEEAKRAFERVGQSPFEGIQTQIDERLAAFDQVGKAAARLREVVGLAAVTVAPRTDAGKTTRHWVEAYVDVDQVSFEVTCEHPKDCQETAEEVRSLGCAVKDFWSDMGPELFGFPRGERTTFGKVEVACDWRGIGEDCELYLIPPTGTKP